MRPAGRLETDSLYFDYPHFPFVCPPELEGEAVRHPVAIVGAGPVGVTAALELARHGIASVVLDDKDTVNDGSRAICISRHSLEILQQLGVDAPFERKGLGWTQGRTYFRDREIYRFRMPHSDQERYYPMVNLQQQYIEQFLIDEAHASELIEMRWQSRLTYVSQGDDGVTLEVTTPEGTYRLQCDYLLAADGGRSRIRESLGLSLHGQAYEGRYVIADVRLKSDFPTERRAFFHSRAMPDTTILVHKQPDDIWRIDYQLAPGEDSDDAVREERIREKVELIVCDVMDEEGDWELEWWSLYKAYTLALDDYRHGRVLFIGDSAHLVPIFGVRGLNNGLADAANAGWKLASVLKGQAPEALLDSYSPERRGATLDVFANAGKSTRFMTPPTRGYALMRDAALALAYHNDYASGFANPRQVTPYTYAESPLTLADDPAFEAGPIPGAPLINRRLGDNDFMLDHLGSGFNLLHFSEEGRVEPALQQQLECLRSRGIDITLLRLTRSPGDEQTLVDVDGSLFAGYGARPGSAYLVRPDRHVVARWISLDPAELDAAVTTALGGE
ncbi:MULTISPECIES: FAD-dependent monooxygenase [unclassified Halomonas]|uniref:FAD-dependent monooxygenase n=1 Tax=unclassified Halomonas TaxID=2609666 RepID=UPI002885961E|nr:MULTISPECIES: FAD-dependent monooxygenase [unclassified Halomonas]MDT0502521.1 FAD-dependent monooxygenase [Halomonas sp. PAR7]MDT0512753.1 FAD-dependent monooxygenase [Halomonas sp. LES1]MDT0591929.1 FAD-dependent monooxygenase [Halomonas sp. PAR8]